MPLHQTKIFNNRPASAGWPSKLSLSTNNDLVLRQSTILCGSSFDNATTAANSRVFDQPVLRASFNNLTLSNNNNNNEPSKAYGNTPHQYKILKQCTMKKKMKISS